MYVHFKTSNETEALYGRFFIWSSQTSSSITVKRLSLKKGTVETEWTQHPNEVKSSVVAIDEKGVSVKHSDASTYTLMNSQGFSIVDNGGDVLAWLSSKNQWTEVHADSVTAKNVRNTYTGPSTLYVDIDVSSTTNAGTSDNPFNTLKSLDTMLSNKILNYTVTIVIRNSIEITEPLYITNVMGDGAIYIYYESSVVHRCRGNDKLNYAINLYNIQPRIFISGNRSSYDAKNGALICDDGSRNGMAFLNCSKVEINYITISVGSYGIYSERTDLYTYCVDFGKCKQCVELQRQSIYYASGDCGSCTTWIALRSTSCK